MGQVPLTSLIIIHAVLYINILVQDIKKAESNPKGIFDNVGGGANSSYISYISYNSSGRFRVEHSCTRHKALAKFNGFYTWPGGPKILLHFLQ